MRRDLGAGRAVRDHLDIKPNQGAKMTRTATPAAKGKFDLGIVVMTPDALEAFRQAAEDPHPYLLRHQQLEAGELSFEDQRENEFSVKEGCRILSAYRLRTGVKFWVITEWDRSSTCMLLPNNY
jgi:hypothetical protein